MPNTDFQKAKLESFLAILAHIHTGKQPDLNHLSQSIFLDGMRRPFEISVSADGNVFEWEGLGRIEYRPKSNRKWYWFIEPWAKSFLTVIVNGEGE